MTPDTVRTVFMGSPEFAVPSLKALADAGYEVVLAVTQPDRPAGRGGRPAPPPVKTAAMDLGIPVHQPETLKDEDARARIADAGAGLVVVAAYGKILPKSVLAMPRHGCVNVHASLLPRWRGASPISAAILAGDRETGVTIMEMVSKMDAGAMIAQRSAPIGPRDTTGTLERELAAAGAELLVESLPQWLEGSLIAKPQDEANATYCWTLSKADGFLSRAMTAAQAERAVRAYNPWPGAFVELKGQRLAIWAARADGEAPPAAPGTVAVIGREPAIAFDPGWLVLEEVQKPGGKRLSGAQFLNGERGLLPPEAGLRD